MSAIRSDSLTRSSAASWSSLVPSAAAIAMASTGSSSMSSATRGPSSRIARSGRPPRTTRSPVGSGPAPPPASSTTSTSAPISRSTSTMARRVGLSATWRRRISADGCTAAATSHVPADWRCRRAPRASGRGSRPDPTIVVRRPSRATGTPIQASSRSVWSRVGPGTSMSVRPGAASAASVTAPSTWALATGSAWVSAASGRAPVMRSGAWPSAVSIARPHPAQRRRDALHGPPRQRGVAAQLDRQRASRERTREEAHRGAGVAAVEASRHPRPAVALPPPCRHRRPRSASCRPASAAAPSDGTQGVRARPP